MKPALGTDLTVKEFVEQYYKPTVDEGNFCGWPFVCTLPHENIRSYDSDMTVSIICCCFMRANHLLELFHTFTRQNWPRDQIEILVIDDNSPTTPERYPNKLYYKHVIELLMRKYSAWNIRAFQTHRTVTYNPALAMNILAKRAAGDLLIFCDADVSMLSKDYILGCVKHHSAIDKLWLSPLLWQVHHGIYKTPTDIPSERFMYDYGSLWSEDWAEPSRGMHLGLEPAVVQWRGGSIKRKHYNALRGNDERARGWGNHDVDLWGRLSRYGFKFACDYTIPAGHVPHPEWVKPPSEETEKNILGKFRAWPLGSHIDICNDNFSNNRLVVNPEGWGEIDTLEEIKCPT